jgi:hypothetical protein
MEKTIDDSIKEITDSVNKISISVAELWRINSSGIPPHKTTLNIMTFILSTSVASLIIGLFLAFEMYLLLQKVHAIYSLMI